MSIRKESDKPGVQKLVRRLEVANGSVRVPSEFAASSRTNALTPANAEPEPVTELATRKPLKISTVSHTLAAEVAERLRHFAFRERISESAVIEFALRGFFESGEDTVLGTRLRNAGAALRRKS